jgi:hypothetical protein
MHCKNDGRRSEAFLSGLWRKDPISVTQLFLSSRYDTMPCCLKIQDSDLGIHIVHAMEIWQSSVQSLLDYNHIVPQTVSAMNEARKNRLG